MGPPSATHCRADAHGPGASPSLCWRQPSPSAPPLPPASAPPSALTPGPHGLATGLSVPSPRTGVRAALSAVPSTVRYCMTRPPELGLVQRGALNTAA